MVFRSNLDDNSISFPPWSTRPRRTRPVAPTKTHLHIDMWIWAMYPYLVRIPLRHTCLVVPTVFFFFPPFKNKYCLIWLGYIFDTFPWYKIWTTKKPLMSPTARPTTSCPVRLHLPMVKPASTRYRHPRHGADLASTASIKILGVLRVCAR